MNIKLANIATETIMAEFKSISILKFNEKNVRNSIIDIVVSPKLSEAFPDGCIFLSDYIKFFRERVHITDLNVFDYIFDIDRIKVKVKDRKKDVVSVKLDMDGLGEYIQHQFEVIYGTDVIALTWKVTDKEYTMYENALRLISRSFCKIVKVNVTEDSCEDIRVSGEFYHHNKFSKWITEFANNGNVYIEDVDDFLQFASISNIRSMFSNKKTIKREFRYRRLSTDGTYRWSAMVLLPSNEYTEQNEIIMLYVKDIHDDYTHQLIKQRREYYTLSHSTLTGLNNKLAYDNTVSRLLDTESLGVAFIYVGLNGSREERINTVKDMASCLREVFNENECYLIDSREFVIISESVTELKFTSKCEALDAYIKDYGLDDTCVVASKWNSDPFVQFTDILNELEQKVYEE